MESDLNIDAALPEERLNISLSSDESPQHKKAEEMTKNQNEFATNENLRSYTDNILSISQASEFRNYRSEKFPTYINCLAEIVKEKQYFTEAEIKSFVVHFCIATLPAFNLRLDSDIKAVELAQRLQVFLQLYVAFARARKACEGLTIVKIAEVEAIDPQQVEIFFKSFGSDVMGLDIEQKIISAEAIISELLFINARILKPMSEKEYTEANIDPAFQMRAYSEIFRDMKEKIVVQVVEKKSLDLKISNQMAAHAFFTLLAVLESKQLSVVYWDLSSEYNEEPFKLNYWARLITFNCKVHPHNGESAKEVPIRIQQIIPSYHIHDEYVKTELVPDPKYADEGALLSLLERFDQLTSEIINNALDCKNFEFITESFITYLEEITNYTNSKLFLTAFSMRKKIEFYHIIKTLLSIVTSPEQYKRILRIVFINIGKKCFHCGESREEVTNLWLAIEEIAKLKHEYTCYSIAVQLEGLHMLIKESNESVSSLSMFSVEEMLEIVLRYLSTFKEMIEEKTLDVRHRGAEVLEAVWNFLNECPAEVVAQYKTELKEFVDIICGVPSLLYQLMLMENTVVQIFQKSFKPERKEIVLYLMEKLFKRIQFNEDDDNIDAELRKRVFHCLRKYTESMNNCFNPSDENETLFAHKTFSFIVRFYITLIEEGSIPDFEEFFEAKPKLCYNEYIFSAFRSNDSQMILLAFVEYYDSLLDVASSGILHGKTTSLCILEMTASILLISPRLHAILTELGCYDKLYRLLSGLRNNYNNQEILEIGNTLFNLATKGGFYYQVEKPIFGDKTDSLEDKIDLLPSFAEFTPIWKYIQIKESFFLSMLLKSLFEWNVCVKIKHFYLQIFESMVISSLSNAGICSQSEIIERLMMYFKIESEDSNKRLLRLLITHILKVSINVSRMKAFVRCMRYNYWDYHREYLNSMVSDFARNEVIEKMANVKDFLKTVFDLLRIQIEVLQDSEDNENFINFNGEQSGIIITNLNQSLKSNLTFLISFRIENYISCDKRNIINNYRILKEQVNERVENRGSCLSTLDGQIQINKNYFEASKTETRQSIIRPGNPLGASESELYNPRLFSIANSNVTLELYVGFQNRKPCLVLDGKLREKKGTVKESKEIYDYCPEENEWCSIFVIYTAKNGFQIYRVTQDPEEPIKKIPKFATQSFSHIIDSFSTVQDFSIGTSPPKFVQQSKTDNLEGDFTISVENSFCGQIKKFYLVKTDLSETEMENIAHQMKLRSENVETRKDSFVVTRKPKKKLLSALPTLNVFASKSEELMDYEQFEANALINSNAFPDLDRVCDDEENQWTFLAHSMISADDIGKSKKKKKSFFFDRKPDKKHEIRAKGVTLLEKNRFEDVLFSIGNVEIILYAFELLQNFDHHKFDNSDRHIIFREILRTIEVLCRSSNKTDVMIFLSQQNGFEFIYVSKFGINGECLDRLLELVKSISHPEDRYKGFMRIFLNFEIWRECDYRLKCLVLERAEEALKDNSILYCFKRDHQFITVLFHLQMLMRLEVSSVPTLSKITSIMDESFSPTQTISELKSESKPVSQIEDFCVVYKDRLRNIVFYALSTPLDMVAEDKDLKMALDSDEILDSECEHLVKYLESCGPTAFLLEFLKIITKLLEIENRNYAERIRENLERMNLKDFITANIYYVTTRRQLTGSYASKRRMTRLAERVLEKNELDTLLFYCVQILRMLIFEAPSRDKSGKSAPFLADFLFGATVNLTNEKDVVLKQDCANIIRLYNYSFDNIEPLTYRALARTIFYPKKTEKNDKYLILKKSPNIIGLIIHKFIKKQINIDERKLFVKELYVCLRNQHCMKIFTMVPNYLHLLHNLLNPDPNSEGADPEIKAVVQKLLKRFINYTLFEEEQCVFSLISLLEFETYMNSEKSSGLAIKKDDTPPAKQLAASNFLKLFKPIENVLNDCKEQLMKQEERKSGDELDKQPESAQLKKILLTNIPQFVFYYEYFITKFNKAIPSEESNIYSFTTTLFEFLFTTQMLHLVYPPIKQLPAELNANSLLKKYENTCYRNGGVLISMLSIIFIVLRFTKMAKEKIELLACCNDIFGLGKRRSGSQIGRSKTGQFQTTSKTTIENPTVGLKELLTDAAKKYPPIEIKQYMNSPLIETTNAEKLPDLLAQKDYLVLYEFCFYQVFKLLVRESRGLMRLRSSHREIDELDSDIQDILTMNADPNDDIDINFSPSVKYSEELVKFLLVLMSANGAGIKSGLTRSPTALELMRNEFTLQKIKYSKIIGYGTKVKSWMVFMKSVLDEFCEDYNEQNKPVKGSPDRSSSQYQSKTDELFHVCKVESVTGKGQKHGNIATKPIDDYMSLLPKAQEFIEKYCLEIAKDVIPSLRNGSLKPFRFIKRLNFIYIKLQIEKEFDEIHKDYEDFSNGIDPKDSIEAFKNKWPIYQKKVDERRTVIHENKKADEHNRIKINTYWAKKKKQLTDERGVWQVEKRETGLTRYKYGKTADHMHRRMRLRVDKKASEIVYLNKEAFEEAKAGKKFESRSPTTASIFDSPSTKSQSLISSTFGDPFIVMPADHNSGQENVPIMRKETSDIPTDVDFDKYADDIQEDSESDSELKSPGKEETMKMGVSTVDSTGSRKKKDKKISKTFQCERITVRGAIWGEIEMTEKYFIFRPLPGERPDGEFYELGALKHNFLTSSKKKGWNYQKIKEVYQKRYNYVRSAFEIFTSDNKSYYFNVYSPNVLKEVLGEFKLRSKDIQLYSGENFMSTDITKRWVEGKMTNFEYLMHINMFAGRSFNDLSQYPVFPWILADFTSEEINIHTTDEKEQKRIFRDLSYPLGAQTEERRRDAKSKVMDLMELGEDEDEVNKDKIEQTFKKALAENELFMYGSHYSTGGHIIDYLVRLEPFTSLQIKLQSGKLDEANRIFSSIPKAWASYFQSHNTQNFKELIPEFFYCPNFLKNRNGIDFGKEIGKVELPAWAKTPEEFIVKHREALESDYVSRNLDKWIDLIFGYKQYGIEAFRAYNLYSSMTYEQVFSTKDRNYQTTFLCQVSEFGQCPIQLFKQKHPERKVRDITQTPIRLANADLIPGESDPKSMIDASPKINESRGVIISHLHTFEDNPIMWVHMDKKSLKIIFKNRNCYDIQYEVTLGMIKPFQWSRRKDKTDFMNLGKIIFNDFNINNQICTLGAKGTESSYMVIGGYQDSSFKILNKQIGPNPESSIRHSVHFHKKLVTSVACCEHEKGYLIIAGSKDCRISTWRFDVKDQKLQSATKPKQIIYGHHSEVVCLAVESSLGILVSADREGVVIIHCLLSEKILYTCYPKLELDEEIKSILIDDNGIVALVTVAYDLKFSNRILVYNINGEALGEFKIDSFHSIRHVSFLEKSKSVLLISTKEGQLMTLNLVGNRVLKPLTSFPLGYKDYAEDIDDSKKAYQRLESRLKNVPINHFYIDKDSTYVICGYERGSIAIVSPKFHSHKLQTIVFNLNDLGFLAAAPEGKSISNK